MGWCSRRASPHRSPGSAAAPPRRAVRPALAVLAAALAAACARPPAERPFVLRLAVVGRFSPLDPLGSEGHAMLAHDLVFQGALAPGADGTPRPGVARVVERRGPRRCRLRLEPAAAFSDGAAVTPEDLARSARAVGLAAETSPDGSVTVSSEGRPVEGALLFTAVFRPGPRGALGTGPYRMVEQSADRMVLERVRPAPRRIARVEVIGFPSERDALARLLRGDVNAMIGLDQRSMDLLEDVPGLRPMRSPGPHAWTVILNERRLGGAQRRRLQAALPVTELASAVCGAEAAGAPAGAERPAREIPPGEPLRILVVGDGVGERRGALALRRALGRRGGEIVPFDAGRGVEEQIAGADLVLTRQVVWPPIVVAQVWAAGSPFAAAGYRDAELEAAIARGDADAAVRRLREDGPAVRLCRTTRAGAVDARIRGAAFGWGALDTLPDWEVAP